MPLSVAALNEATQNQLAASGLFAYETVRALATLSGLTPETIIPTTDYMRAHNVFDYHPERPSSDEVTTRYPSFTAYRPRAEDQFWIEQLQAASVPFDKNYSAIELAAFETANPGDIMKPTKRFVRTRFWKHTSNTEEYFMDPEPYGWSARLSRSGGVGVVSNKLRQTTLHNPSWVGHPDWADRPEELARWQIGALGVSQFVVASIESVHHIPVGAPNAFDELIADWQKAVPAVIEPELSHRYSGGIILDPPAAV